MLKRIQNLEKGLTVKTRLMIMLLIVSLICCGVMSYLGNRYGEKVIGQEVSDQLNLVRSSKKYQIEGYFRRISGILETLGQDASVIQAAQDFKTAFSSVGKDKALNAQCSNKLTEHYTTYMDSLAKNMDVKKDIDLYLPNTVEGCYLQYHYIVNNPNKVSEKDKLLDPKDGSQYSLVHQKYHEFFKLFASKLKLADVFLVDLEGGDVLYSVTKEIDFASNLYNGALRGSKLADLARLLQTNSDLQTATWMDYSAYRPSYGAPAMFVGIPLTDNNVTIGGLIIQMPIDEINRITTGDGNWVADGMGNTGEVYLLGEDYLMRSASRFFNDTTNLKNDLIKKGELPADVERLYRYGTTVMQVRNRSKAALEAFQGKSGVEESTDYRGAKVISSYAPIEWKGLNWAVLAEKDYDEAFLPVRNFAKNMFIQTAALMLVITLLSMWLAGRFVRPIEHLTEGAKRISEGDLNYRVKVETDDEFGVLAQVFNQTVETLDTQIKTVADQSAQTDKMLLNFIPPQYSESIRQGKKNIAEEYSNVSLITIDIEDFGKKANMIDPKTSLNLLNSIISAFDEAASRHQIERIRAASEMYFATCGLFEPHLDHANRMIKFAKEALQIINRINGNIRVPLKLNIHIHCGDVFAGIVGVEKYTFDLWGDTMTALINMNRIEEANTIMVSQAIEERLRDFHKFEEVGKLPNDNLTVFKLI
jgi:methyl-accepting chemotaxis protein